MAISWGAWKYSGSNGMRVGISTSWESISPGEASATCTVKFYTQNQYSYDDDQTLHVSGNVSGGTTQNFHNGAGGGSVLRTTRTYTYTYGAGEVGSSPGNVTFSCNISGAYNGVTPSKSVTTAIPARPASSPAAPSAQSASWNSNTQVTVNWTRNATTSAPYTSQTVQFRIFDNGDWSPWYLAAGVSGSANSYVDSTRYPNRAFQYRVRANNGSGSSAFVETNSVYMKPNAPSGVTANVQSAGDSIKVQWTNNHYSGGGLRNEVRRSVNGGAYTMVVDDLPHASTMWTDPSPGVGSNIYRVYTYTDTGVEQPGLYSEPGQSNTVSTIVAPLAPDLISPDDGDALDLTVDQVFDWEHADGGDGSEQTAYTVEFSDDAGSTWTAHSSGDVTSTDQFYTLPGGTLANGASYRWRVRTQGVISEGFGPYSDGTQEFIGVDGPVITLDEPPAVINDGPITAVWTYSQAQGHPQTRWEARLWLDGALVETQAANDAADTTSFAQPIQDGEVYTVEVRARSSVGVWTDWESTVVEIDLLPPPTPFIDGEYQPCLGIVALDVSIPAPAEGESVSASHIEIQRRIDGGDWVTLTGQLGIEEAETISQVYAEGFEADDGGWAGETEGGAFNAPATTPARQTVYVSEGSGALGIEWDTDATPQNVGFLVTGLTIGETYTYIAQVLNDGAADVRLRVESEGETSSIYTPGFNEDGYGEAGFGGWARVLLTFTATDIEHVLSVINRTPTDSTFTYLDRVVLYEGVAIDYDTGSASTALIDPIPSTTGLNEYRAISFAENGGAAISEILSIQGTNGDGSNLWAFLSYGESFGQVLRMRGDLSLSATSSRVRAAHPFVGRRLPTLMVGENVGKSLSISGVIRWSEDCPADDDCTYDSPRDDWEAAAWDAEIACYRDYTGRRIFGMLGDVSTSDGLLGMASVSFGFEQTGYSERLGENPVTEEG